MPTNDSGYNRAVDHMAQSGDEMHVLLVEDDPRLGPLVQRALEGQGWTCDRVGRGDAALQRLRAGHNYDVVVLDRMLPGCGGVEVCQRVRARGEQVAILMLTARSSVEDRVAGLDAGADDYLVKPFALRELHARVRALHRARTRATGITVDVDGCIATWNGEPVALRTMEAQLLGLLVRAGGGTVRRERLLDELWPDDDGVRDNLLDATVSRLRRAIAALDGPTIATVRGVGYRLQVPT